MTATSTTDTLALIAQVEEVFADSVEDLLDVYVVCRSVGHSWDDNPGADFFSQVEWSICLRCLRCTTERYDALSVLGRVIQRRYVYPNGYRLARNRQGNRLTIEELRLELMRRKLLAHRRTKRPKSRQSA